VAGPVARCGPPGRAPGRPSAPVLEAEPVIDEVATVATFTEVEEVDDTDSPAEEIVVVEATVEETFAPVDEPVVEPEPVAFTAEPVASSADDLLYDLVDEVVPEGDDFDRGLQSLVDEELAPGPVEPPAPEPSTFPSLPEREPTAAADTLTADVVDEEDEAPVKPDPLTAAGLVKRTPKKRGTDSSGAVMAAGSASRSTGQTQRSPEEVRKMLSRYRSGLNKGRGAADSDTTTD
jgi:hypothetical protein